MARTGKQGEKKTSQSAKARPAPSTVRVSLMCIAARTFQSGRMTAFLRLRKRKQDADDLEGLQKRLRSDVSIERRPSTSSGKKHREGSLLEYACFRSDGGE